jgi:hypothetical protein
LHHRLGEKDLVVARGSKLIDLVDAASSAIRCDRSRLLNRTPGRTIRDIRSRQLERPPVIVAAAGVELRGVICEGAQVSPKKLLEAKPCGVELCLAFPQPSLRG